MLGQLLDFALRHADVVQPLHADLFAGALPHGLFYIVARLIGEQPVDPDQALVLGLAAELGLTVDGPTKEPAGVLHCDDAAGDHTAAEGFPLTNVLDIGNDLLV